MPKPSKTNSLPSTRNTLNLDFLQETRRSHTYLTTCFSTTDNSIRHQYPVIYWGISILTWTASGRTIFWLTGFERPRQSNEYGRYGSKIYVSLSGALRTWIQTTFSHKGLVLPRERIVAFYFQSKSENYWVEAGNGSVCQEAFELWFKEESDSCFQPVDR